MQNRILITDASEVSAVGVFRSARNGTGGVVGFKPAGIGTETGTALGSCLAGDCIVSGGNDGAAAFTGEGMLASIEPGLNVDVVIDGEFSSAGTGAGAIAGAVTSTGTGGTVKDGTEVGGAR